MNKTESAKYGYLPNYIESKSLSSKKFRIVFNFKQTKKSKKVSNRLDKYDKTLYLRKKKKLRQDLSIEEKVLLLAEGIKKKSALGKFYKSSVQNISYLNKEKRFVISNKKQLITRRFIGLQM